MSKIESRKAVALAVAAAAAVLLTACGSAGGSETAAEPPASATAAPTTTTAAPVESTQPPCSFIRPIKDHVTNGSVTQATLDQWQAVLTVGCPARQGEFAEAVQVWRDAEASASASAAAVPTDKAAQRAELIAAADATVQAELLVMLGNATAPGSAAAQSAVKAFGQASIAYGAASDKYGADNPDVTGAVKSLGPVFIMSGKVSDRQLLDFYTRLHAVYKPVTGWNYMDHRAEYEATWASYGGSTLKR